jgi:hypothetical protein
MSLTGWQRYEGDGDIDVVSEWRVDNDGYSLVILLFS